MSLAEYRTSTDVDVSLVDPFAERLLGLLEHFGGRLLIVSGRRSRAEQQALYDAWIAGIGNLAAEPGTSEHEKGRAADLRIVDDAVTWRLVHTEAEIRGLRFPIYREDWHVEADPAWVAPPHPATAPEVPDMVGLIHTPTVRPGAPAVVDFTWLPEEGRTWNGRVCSSTLIVRRGTGDPEVHIYFDGEERVVQVPEDGRPVAIGVPVAGLCSVVGAGVVAEAREFWT